MRSKDADRITNRVDIDQTAPSDLGLHCLLRPICPNISNYYGNTISGKDGIKETHVIKHAQYLQQKNYPVCCLVIRGSAGGFLLLRDFSGGVLQPRGIRVSPYVVSFESSSLNHQRPCS